MVAHISIQSVYQLDHHYKSCINTQQTSQKNNLNKMFHDKQWSNHGLTWSNNGLTMIYMS